MIYLTYFIVNFKLFLFNLFIPFGIKKLNNVKEIQRYKYDSVVLTF